MKSEQKLKERVPLKEIQAKRERARIVARFCGYASLVFFIEFVYFFFQAATIRALAWGGRIHTDLVVCYSHSFPFWQDAFRLCLSQYL